MVLYQLYAYLCLMNILSMTDIRETAHDFLTVKHDTMPLHGASSGRGWRVSLQLWRLAENILNKQSRKADKGWSFRLGVGRRANNHSP